MNADFKHFIEINIEYEEKKLNKIKQFEFGKETKEHREQREFVEELINKLKNEI